MKTYSIRILCLLLCLFMAACLFGGCVAVRSDKITDASADQPTPKNDEAQGNDADASSEPEQSEPPSAAELRGQKRVITGKDIGYYAGEDWMVPDVLPTSNVLDYNYPTSLAIKQYGEDVLYRVTFMIGGTFSDCELKGDEMISQRYAYLDSLGIPYEEVERAYGVAWCSADLSYEEMKKLGSYGGINNFELFLDAEPEGNGVILGPLLEEMEIAGEEELLRVAIDWDIDFFDELTHAAISSGGELTEAEQSAIHRNVYYHALDGLVCGDGTLGELFAARETVVYQYTYYTKLTVSEILALAQTGPAHVLRHRDIGEPGGNLDAISEENDGNSTVLYADRFRTAEDIPEEWHFLSE